MTELTYEKIKAAVKMIHENSPLVEPERWWPYSKGWYTIDYTTLAIQKVARLTQKRIVDNDY